MPVCHGCQGLLLCATYLPTQHPHTIQTRFGACPMCLQVRSPLPMQDINLVASLMRLLECHMDEFKQV